MTSSYQSIARSLLRNTRTTDSPAAAKSAEFLFCLAPRSAACALLTAALLSLAPVVSHAATVTVTPTVTASGDLFHYDYSIANSTAGDSFLIDIPVPTGPGVVTDLVAPSGFTTAYDSGLGLVSFLENTSTFGPSAIDGFAFDSPDSPGQVMFEATLVDSNFNLYTLDGPTTAPVPEPFYFPAFLGIAALTIFGGSRLKSMVQR